MVRNARSVLWKAAGRLPKTYLLSVFSNKFHGYNAMILHSWKSWRGSWIMIFLARSWNMTTACLIGHGFFAMFMDAFMAFMPWIMAHAVKSMRFRGNSMITAFLSKIDPLGTTPHSSGTTFCSEALGQSCTSGHREARDQGLTKGPSHNCSRPERAELPNLSIDRRRRYCCPMLSRGRRV